MGATDEVNFYYDSQTLPVGAPPYTREYTAGRLVAQTYGTGSNGDYYSYDALGHTKLKYQQIGTFNYRMTADYNRAGTVTALTYPSNHTITNSLDTAGRLLSVAGNLGAGGGNRTYTSGILYTPSGALTKEQFGTTTPVYNKLFYNSRGQLAEIRTGTSYTGPTDYSADRGAFVNSYSAQCSGICLGSSMTDNNGNLKKQEIYIPNTQMRWQQFEYDTLNRLSWVREVLDGGAEQWKQQFDYDRWGNRTINAGITYGGINEQQFAVTKANNRLGVPGGASATMSYDDAGNLTYDDYSGKGNRTYDGESRITSAWGGNNQAQLYGYDGSGQRIKRTVDGVTTWQVYGISGELFAEYPVNGAETSPQKEYGYRNGQLLVTASPGGSSSSTQNVAWTNAMGVSPSGNSLTKTGSAGWNAGAVSTQTISSGDGYVEFTASETNLARMCGLGNSDTGQNYTDIEFAIQLTASDGTNGVWVFESGTLRGNFGTYSAGDKFRVAVEGGVVKYYKISGGNQTLLYTSTVTPSYPLLVDTSMYSTSSTVTNAVILNGPSVSFTNATGVSVAGNTLTKTGAAGWNAGAVSTQTITSGDGYVEFTASETNLARMCGLGNTDSGQNYTDIEFAIQLTASDGTNGVWVFESGTLRGNFGAYVTGDTFRVAVEAGVVKYKKNGTVFYTSTVTPTYPLLVDTSMYSTGTTVSNIVFSGASGSASQIQWIVSDQLGTPRMIIDDTGSLATVKRHDYLPFGEDLSTIGGRTAAQGYSVGDGVRQQFTSKERDVETGLDYFNARYYSSIQGRFTSPDEFTGGPLELYYFAASASANPTFYADVRNPQSLNKYQYSYNNPLRYVDPNGHAPDQDPKCACPTDQRIIEDILSLPDTVADATGISALADWLRATVPAIVKHIAESQKCMDPGTCGQSIIMQQKITPKEVVIDGSKHPESAANAADAQKAGKPDTVTVDRAGAGDRRREALKGTKSVPGKDRDEYPPAVFKEGGRGAQVRPINPSDNRGAGASIGQQIKDVRDGEKVKIVIKNWWHSLLP